MINGLPRSNTINDFMRLFICCPIKICIIGEFIDKQLEIPIFNLFTSGVRKRRGKTKEGGVMSTVEEAGCGDHSR